MIAVILLLLITIAIVGLAFTFFQRTTESATQSGQQQLEQQTAQIGTQFVIDGADRNKVYIRNLGSPPLTGLAFYVNNVAVTYSGPSSLASGAVGTYFLNDSQLAMLPDPATLRAAGGAISDSRNVCFYCNYYVGYWKLDENGGTTAADSSVNGNDGTINGAMWTVGKVGSALSFDGVNDVVNVGSANILNPTTQTTWSAWFNTRGITGVQNIIRKQWSGGHWIRFENPSTVSFNLIGVGFLSAAFTPVNNQWYNILVTYDGSQMRIYVDGALIGSASRSGTPPANTLPFLIGAGYVLDNPNSIGESFNGIIDDVRVINIARSMTTT